VSRYGSFTRRCPSGKRRFVAEAAAYMEMVRIEARGGTPGNVYRCERCFGWHLTRRRPGEGREEGGGGRVGRGTLSSRGGAR
jgi:hypothetical protein